MEPIQGFSGQKRLISPLLRLYPVTKIWECRPQTHFPANYPTYRRHIMSISPPASHLVHLYTEKQLMRKIKETVGRKEERKEKKGRKTASLSSSPKAVKRLVGRSGLSPPLRLLRSGQPFKVRTFCPLFSTRNSLSATPKQGCPFQRRPQRDVGTYCEPMLGWSEDLQLAGSLEDSNRTMRA